MEGSQHNRAFPKGNPIDLICLKMSVRYAATTQCSVPNVLLAGITNGTGRFVLAAYLINIFKQVELIGLPYESTTGTQP